MAAILIPVQVLSFFILLAGPEGSSDFGYFTADFEANQETEDGAFAAGALTSLIGTLAFVLAAGAAYRHISETALGFEPEWRESIGFALRRFHSLLWVAVLAVLLICLGFVALVIPGVWLYAALAISFPALLSEGARGTKALKRSRDLVKGQWWHVAGALLVSALLLFVLQFALGALLGLVFGFTDSGSQAFDALLATLVGLGTSMVGTPFQVAVLALLYFDLRVRKEGIDLAIAAERIGAPGSEPVVAVADRSASAPPPPPPPQPTDPPPPPPPGPNRGE